MIINCKGIADKIIDEVKECIFEENRKYYLTIIKVGESKEAISYLNMIKKTCDEVDIEVLLENYPEQITERELILCINCLNRTRRSKILLLSPLPSHLNYQTIASLISPEKDIDGINPINLGKVMLGKMDNTPCTALAIVKILNSLRNELKGKSVAIIGRSNTVGKPLAMMLTNLDYTVTLCHSKTNNLEMKTWEADIVISAVGIPNFIKPHMVNEEAIVIDAGINVVNGKVVGDCHEDIYDKVRLVTCVPNGVGLVTNATLVAKIIE